MKKFMMVFLGADYGELGLTPEQIQGRMGKWFGWTDKMKAAGIMVAGEALQGPGKRITGKDRVISDGPFVESKEMVGGFYVVTAESFDEMVKIAEDYPDYDLGGTVEIREVVNFENYE